MRLLIPCVFVSTMLLLSVHPKEPAGTPKLNAKPAAEGPPVLWREPVDVTSRNLIYGPGGQAHQPASDLTFLSEDTTGASPKFEAVDEQGVHWKVKLGIEARPE